MTTEKFTRYRVDEGYFGSRPRIVAEEWTVGPKAAMVQRYTWARNRTTHKAFEEAAQTPVAALNQWIAQLDAQRIATAKMYATAHARHNAALQASVDENGNLVLPKWSKKWEEDE